MTTLSYALAHLYVDHAHTRMRLAKYAHARGYERDCWVHLLFWQYWLSEADQVTRCEDLGVCQSLNPRCPQCPHKALKTPLEGVKRVREGVCMG